MIRDIEALMAELRKGRTISRLDGFDATLKAPKLRWAVVETGETVPKRVVGRLLRNTKITLDIVQRDLIGEPMQIGIAA